MVGIIFSRSKLTNLQKQVCGSMKDSVLYDELHLVLNACNHFDFQVCAHIVQAIRMEATRVREEWEHAISSKENANSQPSDDDASSDAYCFELLSMVLALSGSNVGRQYLAQQLTLMQDLFSLLHTASPRVQRQVGGGTYTCTVLHFTHVHFDYFKSAMLCFLVNQLMCFIDKISHRISFNFLNKLKI